MRKALGVAVLLAALALWPGAEERTQADQDHYGGTVTMALGTTTPGAPRAVTMTLALPAGDLYTDQTLLIEPAAATFTPGCNKPGYRDFNNDDAVDTGETPCLDAGDTAGARSWFGSVRVLNEPCNTPFVSVFDLYSVAMPNNELDPRASTNIAYPRPEGSSNRFNGWAVGAEALGGTAPLDVESDTRADAGSLAIQNYPSYLLDLFDPDGPGPINPVLPIAVYGGLTNVAGTWFPFFYAQFAAGALGTAFAGEFPHPYSRLTAGVGQPGVLVSEDPTAEIPDPVGFVRCSPSTEQLSLFATAGGDSRATNPTSSTIGTHISMAWQLSIRDLENDGYENGLDLCPRVANIEDPRATSGSDTDGIDPACDPAPASNSNGDYDSDGWPNGRDNCPLWSNPTQADSETAYPPDSFAAAFDGGPLGDRIGDFCEGGTVSFTQNNQATTINPTMAEANGHYHIAATPLPECYGGTDVDNDGYCGLAQDGADSGACTSAQPPNCVVRHASWTVAALAPFMAFDTDRGGADNVSGTDAGGTGEGTSCPGGPTDLCPENAFDSDWFEFYVGTNPAQACARSATPNDEPYDSWLWDFNDDQRANLSDITGMAPSFGKFVNGTGGKVRTDVNVDGQTNLSDVTAFGPHFNKQCRATDGTFGGPQ